eukprot:gene3231-4044_t
MLGQSHRLHHSARSGRAGFGEHWKYVTHFVEMMDIWCANEAFDFSVWKYFAKHHEDERAPHQVFLGALRANDPRLAGLPKDDLHVIEIDVTRGEEWNPA